LDTVTATDTATAPDTATPAAVGTACTTDEDCPGGMCLTWLPGGTCAPACGPAAPCPANSVCAPIYSDPAMPIRNLCLALCDTVADCREGYACDDDTTCWPIDNPIGKSKPIGAACRVANECASNLCQP